MTRNSRMPESLAADLDAECSACLMGARRLGELFDRYGVETVESCFDAIIDRTTETYRREILAKIPVGTWVWEDYAEHDGVDEPMLHTQRITLTRTAGRRPGRRAADPRLRRHLAAGEGPDQPLRRLQRRRLPEEVAGADPAQPRRHPRADGRARRQRGHRAADRDAVPAARHAAHAGLPGADQRPHVRDPAAARRARRRGRQGRRRPDARRPGDDPLHRRVRRRPRGPPVPHARGARRRLRRPLLRRRRGHHPRRARLAEPADRVHRGALPVPGRVARRWRWTPAEPGQFRGGLGYEKHIRMLKDAHFMSIADRSILACWGVKGGLAGKPFEVAIDPGGPNEREVDALADAEPVKAGEVIRIRTTGGGGWGNPLERDPALVVRDVVWRKVSPEAALARLRRGAHRLARRRLAGVRRGRDRRRARRPAGAERGVLRPRPGLRRAWPAVRPTPRSTWSEGPASPRGVQVGLLLAGRAEPHPAQREQDASGQPAEPPTRRR